MRDFEDFLPHVMPYAPGCAEPTAIHNLRQAAMEFCERTRLWRSDDEFDVTPNDCDVVCVPSGAQLIEIEHAKFNGFPLVPKAIVDLDRDTPYWRDDKDTTQPVYFTQLEPETVRVVPAATGTLKLFTILKPAEDGDTVPDWMYDKYARVIAAGALKDILLTPGQPFYNAELAAGFSARFYAALDDKASMHVRGQQRAPVRTRSQFL